MFRSAQSVMLAVLLASASLQNVEAGWIDVDTPEDKRTTTSFIDGTTYHLVMSDEFNVPNRTFTDGHDPMWTALDKSDDDSNEAGGGSLHFYNSTTVTTTEDGMLEIRSYPHNTEWNHFDTRKKKYRKVTKNFNSGMVQSWNKFCFTGGILEVDLIFPGDPHIGGLWPAAWMLGNLGRATYEASTNNIWPWSYNTCDRKLQQAQKISKCNVHNHYGLSKHKGRGATEIDLIEVMTGKPGPLPSSDPVISLPYVDMTLQVAPGIPNNRPREGYQPVYKQTISKNGHVQTLAENWYQGLEYYGNTSINPFFYGTWLGETKPEEPVQRTKYQAFQADAVGAMHQITPSHFNTTHSFRLEWQPGPGGRLDWFVKAYKANNTMNNSIEGDGHGTEWVKALTIKDESLANAMGSQIPTEPSYFIFNTAISSTWGFPYSYPSYCPEKKCYDCTDPNCQCSFNPGFCQMMAKNVSFYVDFIRVYQSKNSSAHVGYNHTVGCDPVEYPTREWIEGKEYLYSRPPPFGYTDTGPLKKIKNGGGSCETDNDCGGGGTARKGDGTTDGEVVTPERMRQTEKNGTTPHYVGGRGKCVPGTKVRYQKHPVVEKVCECNPGFTGPNCLANDHKDDFPGALELSKKTFSGAAQPFLPNFLWISVLVLIGMVLVVTVHQAVQKKKDGGMYRELVTSPGSMQMGGLKRPEFRQTGESNLVITGRSV